MSNPTSAEKLWEYEAVQPGQDGPTTVVTLTPEHIAGEVAYLNGTGRETCQDRYGVAEMTEAVIDAAIAQQAILDKRGAGDRLIAEQL